MFGRTKDQYVTKTYAGSGWLKEREAKRNANRGHKKMLGQGYRIHSTSVSNSKGTLTGWQRFEIVATYELIAGGSDGQQA